MSEESPSGTRVSGRERMRPGFTLIEIIVVLAVVAALTAILTPMVVRYVEDARTSRARSDVKVIGSGVAQFFRDVGTGPIYSTNTNFQNRNADISFLHGNGNSPAVSGSGWPTSGGTFDETATSTDAIADQLIANDDGTGTDIYPTSSPGGQPGEGAFWQGPYMESVGADPWGQRYLVVVEGFHPGSSNAVYGVSAGQNGEVETDALQARRGELTVSGDDMIFRVR